jgi:hypothetical protein
VSGRVIRPSLLATRLRCSPCLRCSTNCNWRRRERSRRRIPRDRPRPRGRISGSWNPLRSRSRIAPGAARRSYVGCNASLIFDACIGLREDGGAVLVLGQAGIDEGQG